MASNDIKSTEDFRKFSKDVTWTVTVNYTKEWKLRLWTAKALMFLAVTVLGGGIEFVDSKIESED
jgi:hypothetical protein